MRYSWLIAQLATPLAAFSGWMVAFPIAHQEEHDRHLPPPPPAWVAALDTDANGEISAEELAKATESLKKLDANEDGKLDREELRPHPGHPGHEGARGPRGDSEPEGPRGPAPGFDGTRDGGPGFGAPRRGGPGFDGPRGNRPKFDGPREGGQRRVPTFEQVDVSGDGVIDRDEFNAAMQREHGGRGPGRAEGRRPNERRPGRGRPESEQDPREAEDA